MAHLVTLASGVVLEQLAGEVLVVVPGNDVVRLSGAPADLVLDLQAGKQVDSSHPSVSDLAQLGVVTVSGLSRRSLLKAGAIGAGAGITVLSMPNVAAASSPSTSTSSPSTSTSSINWIEIRGFSDPYGGPWGFEIQNNRGFSGMVDELPLLSPGMPFPPPTTDIADVSSLSLFIGSNEPIVIPVVYSELAGDPVFIGWFDNSNPTLDDPGDQSIGEFTWETPDGTLYYRVTFRKDWSSFAP